MSDELTRALHELASAHETPPPVTGSEIRARAVRRSRRRTTVLSATAVAVALLTLTFGLTRGADAPAPRPHSPAAQPAATEPTPAEPRPAEPSPSAVTALPSAGTIDPRKGTLTVGDRVMKLATGLGKSFTLTGPLTITQKPGAKTLTFGSGSDGTRYDVVIASAVELLDADRRPVYIGASDAYGTDGISTHQTTDGWLVLGPSDAKWFYGAAEPGTVLSVVP